MPKGAGGSEIPVEVLQQAFDRAGLSLSDVARGMGYWRPPRPPRNPVAFGDVTTVKRLMGRAPSSAGPGSRGGKRSFVRRRVRYDTAVRFVRACGLDPVDFDL